MLAYPLLRRFYRTHEPRPVDAAQETDTLGIMQTHFTLLAVLGALLILSPLVQRLTSRIDVPAPVGYIGLGVLIAATDQYWGIVDLTFETVFSVLAELGVVALLFRVGLRSHLQALLAKLPDASLLWLGNVVACLAIGFCVCYYPIGLSGLTSVVIATAFSATSVAISVSVWDELGLLQTPAGSLLIDVAELDDLSSVLLLTILLATLPLLLADNGGVAAAAAATAMATGLKLLLFIAICFLFSHYLEQRFTRFNRRIGEDNTALAITILGAGLAIAAAAGALGFSLAIGALFAGLAFSRDPEVVRNEGKFSDFYRFFAPFFFIHIGMQVQPAAFVDGLGLGLVLFVTAAVSKLLGVVLPGLLVLSRQSALALGLSMIPRAEIALLVVYQCRELDDRVVPDDVFAAVVVASVLTSVVAAPLVRWQLSKESRAGSF